MEEERIKLNILRFDLGDPIDDFDIDPIDEDIQYSNGSRFEINSDLKIEGTNRSLKTVDTDLSNVIALDATRITIPVKLWTNSNPHASFSAQTINIPNLKDYDYIEIFFKNWVSGHYGFMSTKCPVANGNAFALCYTIVLFSGTTASTGHIGERLGTMNTSNNTITFENNFGTVVGSSPYSNSDNKWGVPQFILGYKFSQGGNS